MPAETLRGARIAVTGASGFVGTRLVAALCAAGAVVLGYGRRPLAAAPHANLGYRAWDIAEGPLPDAPTVDALVHGAGLVTDWGDAALFQRCHVEGTRHVLASFAEPCPVVHLSTASVYEPHAPKRLLREDAPRARRHLNAYSRTKALAEQLVLARERAIVLRPHALYGPGDTVLLPRLLDACRGSRLLAAGNGTNRVSLTHVDNLVDAVVLALQALLERRARGVFNIADAEPVVMHDALCAVLEACGLAPRIAYLPRPLAYGLGALLEAAHATLLRHRPPRLTRYRVVQVADEYTLDLTRARQELGYRPSRDLFGFIEGGGLRDQAGVVRRTCSLP